MNLLNKVRSYMLGTDYDEDDETLIDEYDEEMIDEEPRHREREREKERESLANTRPRRTTPDSNVLNLPTANLNAEIKMKVVICRPEVVDDATSICDHLKSNVICVVNLEGVERMNAQRIADFLGGSCYALNGEIQRISNDIFLIAPANIGISSELREELKANGLILPWISSAFK